MSEVIITLFSGLIAAVISYIVSKKQIYTDVTTKSRIDWIQRVRELSIKFIQSYPNSVKMKELFISLRIYLNPCEKIDADIIQTAEKCITGNAEINDFSNQIQAYLKTEWERVKIESKGKKFYSYMFEEKYYDNLDSIEHKKEIKKSCFDKFIYRTDSVLNIIIKTFVVLIIITLFISLFIVHHKDLLSLLFSCK